MPIQLELRDPFGIIAGRMTCRSGACETDFDQALPMIGDYGIVVFALARNDIAAYTLKLDRAHGLGETASGSSAMR